MRPDRNLALDSCVSPNRARWPPAAGWDARRQGGDGAAVDAMRQLVRSVSMRGVVVIGEGEEDQAPMLYNGEEVGNGWGPACDFAVDPVAGPSLLPAIAVRSRKRIRCGRAGRAIQWIGGSAGRRLAWQPRAIPTIP
jgi:hypothetical protein